MDRIVLSGGWSGEWEGEDGEYEEYRAILALQSHPALGALRGRLQAAAAIDGLPEERRGKLHEDGLLDSWGALGCFDDEQGVRVPPWYPPDLVPPDDVPELPTVSGFLCDDCGQRGALPAVGGPHRILVLCNKHGCPTVCVRRGFHGVVRRRAGGVHGGMVAPVA
jgi:hypothetical protein